MSPMRNGIAGFAASQVHHTDDLMRCGMPPFYTYTSFEVRCSVSRWSPDEGLRAHRQALRFRYLSGLVLEPDRQSRPKELPRARPPRKVRLRITLRSEVGCPAWRRIYRRAWQPTVASPPIQLRGSSVCMSVRVSMDFMPVSLHQVRYIHRSADPIHPTPVAVHRQIGPRTSDRRSIVPSLFD